MYDSYFQTCATLLVCRPQGASVSYGHVCLLFVFIVTVCVFVRHLFSFYPFYFDFHSARIIFDVSSGFYLWNINKTTA